MKERNWSELEAETQQVFEALGSEPNFLEGGDVLLYKGVNDDIRVELSKDSRTIWAEHYLGKLQAIADHNSHAYKEQLEKYVEDRTAITSTLRPYGLRPVSTDIDRDLFVNIGYQFDENDF